MTEPEFERFAEAVNKLHFDGTWKQIYTLHHASGSHAHSTNHFLHWHRRFLHDVETLLQDAAKQLHPDEDPCKVTLPYWNWAEDFNMNHSCQESFHSGDHYIFTCSRYGTLKPGDRMVTDGAFGWNTFNRKPNNALLRVSPGTYADVQRDVEDAVHLDFTNFRWTLENRYHNSPHCSVGGTMCSFESPKDPLFFAHHTFVDRLWYTWQKKKARTGSSGWDASPAEPLEHLLCPSGSNEPSAWTDSENLQGVTEAVKVNYATRAEMSEKVSDLLLQESGGNSAHRTANYWKAKVDGIVECCQEGLADRAIHAAKATIRDADGNDVCAPNFHNMDYDGDLQWCEVEGGTDCPERTAAVVAENMQEESQLLHCEVPNPGPEERRTCMALYSNTTCEGNMFDLCLKHKIKHSGSQSQCIPKAIAKKVKRCRERKKVGRCLRNRLGNL